jgi:hypothetical protein
VLVGGRGVCGYGGRGVSGIGDGREYVVWMMRSVWVGGRGVCGLEDEECVV